MHPELLRKVELFRGLERSALDQIALLMHPQVYAPHRVVFRKGDAANGCYVVVSGEVEVLVGGGTPNSTQTLARLGPGSLFGEVALIDGGPRTATCTAGPRGAGLAFLGRTEFLRVAAAADPLAFELLDRVALGIVERLRSAPAQLQSVMLNRRVLGGAD